MATTTVNGRVCLNPAYDVKQNDIVFYDGRRLRIIEEKKVIMLHKPKNVITTVKDTHGRKTVMDFINYKIRLCPIGRLDKNTTGLLLFTNDGKLQNYLTHPSNNIPKDYEVVIEGNFEDRNIKKLKRGIYIGENEYGKAEVINKRIDKGRTNLSLRLRHGKKREIRRILFRLNKKLISLKRISFSNVKLGSLKEGKSRELSMEEIKLLYKK